MLDRLSKAQRVLSRRTKGSGRWNKQRIRVVKLHEKVANQRKNVLHHKSKELATKSNDEPRSSASNSLLGR